MGLKSKPELTKTPGPTSCTTRGSTLPPAGQSSAARELFPRKHVDVATGPSADEKGAGIANLITSAEHAAMRVIAVAQPLSLAQQVDAPTLLAVLREQQKEVSSGDLTRVEAALMGQASALQALFVHLSECAMQQSQAANIDAYLRLALKAQSQCRATLETVAAMRNPPALHVRQTNIAAGPQQINNALAVRRPKNSPNQLSGASADELSPISRSQGFARKTNPQLEALGAVDRAAVRPGQGQFRKARL
jgi:hypothetical protein